MIYKLIKGRSLHVEKLVSEAITEGWLLHGITFRIDPGYEKDYTGIKHPYDRYAQAVIFEGKEIIKKESE